MMLIAFEETPVSGRGGLASAPDPIPSACILAIGMKDLVDVDCVGLLPLSLALLLVTLGNSLGRLSGSFTRGGISKPSLVCKVQVICNICYHVQRDKDGI